MNKVLRTMLLLKKKSRKTLRRSTENRTCLMMLLKIKNKPLKIHNLRMTKI